ncbi:hypothetical protein D3C71_1832040 [compost metagenome]
MADLGLGGRLVRAEHDIHGLAWLELEAGRPLEMKRQRVFGNQVAGQEPGGVHGHDEPRR